MLMQEAFRRALDQLEQDDHVPQLDPRNLTVLHLAAQDGSATPGLTNPDAQVGKLIYRARKLASRWCSYARPNQDVPWVLETLRDDWVVFARQLALVSQPQRIQALWELACTMRPGTVKFDADRFRYLTHRAAALPDHFVGLTASPHIPWPGPASFLVHAVEELEAASAEERGELHRIIDEQWTDEPLWLIDALVGWVQSRHQ